MGAGSTQLTYNGVTIFNCQTREFREENVFDQSNTDQVFHKYRLSVIGYIHGGLPGKSASAVYLGVFPNPGNQDAAAHHKDVKAALMSPRGTLVYTLGSSGSGDGTVLVTAKPFALGQMSDHKDRDVENGPKPQSFEIVSIAGNNVLRVQYTIEFSLIHCGADDTGLGRRDGVLNNRWSCSDAIDGNYFTVRTWRGTLRLATALHNPHLFRGHCVPRLAPGFHRQSLDFEASPDGLTLSYTVVDREIYAAPPKPATSWNVSHTESVRAENSLVAMGSCTVELWGDRRANKRQLAILAVAISDQCMDYLKENEADDNKAFITSVSLTNNFGSSGENSVRFHVEVMHLKGTHPEDPKNVLVRAEDDNLDNGEILNLQVGSWGRLFPNGVIVNGYNPDLSRGSREGDEIELEGPAGVVGAFVAHLQSICDNRYSMEDALTADGELVPLESPAVPSLTARVVQTVAESVPEWTSDSHREHIYTHWDMDCTFEVAENTVALPYADASLFDRSSGSASGVNTVAVIHLSAPLAQRIIRLRGQRIGADPELPTVPTTFTDQNNITYTRQHSVDVILAPAYGPGDSEIRTIQAEYRYWMSRPPASTDTMPVGYNPWNTIGLTSVSEDIRTVEEF